MAGLLDWDVATAPIVAEDDPSSVIANRVAVSDRYAHILFGSGDRIKSAALESLGQMVG